jgi:hypothetical protein
VHLILPFGVPSIKNKFILFPRLAIILYLSRNSLFVI